MRPPAAVANPDLLARLVPTIDQVWTVVALALPAIAGLTAMTTIDLAYHIRLGDLILRSGIPRVDSFTFTAGGRPWLDQQWAAQAVLAWVYGAGGWAALSLLRALSMVLTFAPVWMASRARGASARSASLLTLASFVVSYSNLGMRPQMLALPLFTTTVWLVLDRRNHPRRIWLVPLMSVVWANLHGSFVMAPAILGLALVEDIVRREATLRRTALVTGVTLVATLLNPFGIGAWRYALTIITNPTIRTAVQEWAPTTIRSLTGALFFVSAFGVAILLARRRMAASWSSILWLGVLALMALPALRGVIWWGLAAPPIVAELTAGTRDARPARRDRAAINVIAVGSLLLTFGLFLPWHSEQDPRTGAAPQLIDPPQRLVEATAAAIPAGGRLFVSEVWGSWFEFSLPEDPLFVDSRIEIFPDRIWSEYDDVMNGRDGWQDILDRWRVDAVVLPRGEPIDSRIARDPAWHLAYRDDQGSLFVRA